MSWLAWPWYFICKVNSTNRVFLLKNTLCALCLRSWGFHAMPFLIVISCKVPLLRNSFKSDSWRRCTCTNVLLVCEGELRELVQPGSMSGLPWGLLCGKSGRKDLCMVPCHSCHTFVGFGQAGAKRCGGCLKFISWGWRCKSQKGALFIGKAVSHYVILLYCETLLQVLLGIYSKRFYWIPLFTILLLFYVFEVGKAKSATQSVLMILTLNGLFQKIF